MSHDQDRSSVGSRKGVDVLGQRRPSEVTTVNRSHRARWLEAGGFVATWAAIGTVLDLGTNAYLLVGVPLTAAFQVLIRRRPLRELWVRRRPGMTGAPIRKRLVGLLAVAPAVLFVQGTLSGQLDVALYGLAAVGGAVGVGYAAAQASRPTWSATARCLAMTVPIAGVVFVAAAVARHLHGHTGHGVLAGLAIGAWSFALYVPATFVIEEVAFRGAIDSHVHHPTDPSAWLDAIAVSALWGLWHLPLTGVTVPSVIAVIVVQTAIGVPLSFAWRRTENLLAPGVTHAAIDAIRNVLLSI